MKQYILVIFINSLMSRDYDIIKEFDNFNYIISCIYFVFASPDWIGIFLLVSSIGLYFKINIV